MTFSQDPVHTESGLLRGTPAGRDSVTVFKGIPYAATTAGENRWRPPQPPEPWEGVRVADSFGDISPQHDDVPVAGRDGIGRSENCLNLNIWTGAASAGERRPVLVWVHGGRFLFGHGSDPNYDGTALADKGLVVVTLNYRTGVFGYLATPELSAESGQGGSGNYGLLDIVAALRWVRRNIAGFGGDPDRVTLAGQSSGGASTLDLIYSPLAKGLFHRAIVHSAALYPKDPAISTLSPSHRSLAQAEADGAAFGAARGATTLAELRALPVEKLLEGSDVNDTSLPGNPPPPLFRPVIDGWVLPADYWTTLDSGAQNQVDVLTGNNLDESGAKPRQDIALAEYESRARARYGDMADEFLRLYPAATDEEAGDQLNASLREATRLSTYFWALLWGRKAKTPVYTYYWTHVPPGEEGTARGAYHGSEINYFLDTLADADAEERRIAEKLSGCVVNFAASGDPGLPNWQTVSADSQTTLQVGDGWRPMPLADDAKAEFFQRFFETQKAW
ncbi:carboxylesterase/lipase family protein [Streptomyces canus]|uniref:carboxylesterase/lipase family protein n=1 Tax=Streptomyces canus TaxID=58343 RepID=UPI0036ACE4A4